MRNLFVLLLSFGLVGQSRSAHPLDHWSWGNPLPIGNSLLAITFGSDRFVAVGEASVILVSTNAANWIVQTSPSSRTLRAVTHHEGTFVTVGDDGTILTSPDAQTWTSRASSTAGRLLALT